MGLRGYIDGVIGDELVGWAVDEDAPDSRLRVRGELDGIVLGTVEACEPRRDLVAAGFGDGSYGFRIALDPDRLTPGVHPVAATVRGESLPLAPDWIVRDGHDRPVELVQLAAGAPAGGAAETTAAPAPEIAEPDTVVSGVAGWSFVLPARAGERSHAQLDADAAAIEELHALAGSLGVIASAVAVPSKHLLYAEHLPAERRIDSSERPARRLAARLRDSDSASLLDLHDPLQDARVHGRLYPRTGRHLTWTGAIHGYRAIAKALAGSVSAARPHPVDAFDYGTLEPVADAVEHDDTEPALAMRPASASKGPVGLVVHDGTAGRIAELLGLQFSRCRVVVAERVDSELMRCERPDIVVWIREDR